MMCRMSAAAAAALSFCAEACFFFNSSISLKNRESRVSVLSPGSML
jgi:hypothetical protein